MSNSPAIEHSLKRLAKAKKALSDLEQAPDLRESEHAWSDLLIAAAGVHTKLEQGSKRNDKTKAWFGRKKNERRTDQLLCYAHHARNSDEHCIDEITAVAHAGSASISFREPYDPEKLEGVKVTVGTDRSGNVRVSSSDETVVSIGMYSEDCLRLVTVRDRRDKYHPPFEHLGKELPDQSPVTIGRFLVAYLEQLVEDAKLIGI